MMESRWDSELPRLHLGPNQTWVTGLVRVKPGFQRGQQLVTLFGIQVFFVGLQVVHSLGGA